MSHNFWIQLARNNEKNQRRSLHDTSSSFLFQILHSCPWNMFLCKYINYPPIPHLNVHAEINLTDKSFWPCKAAQPKLHIFEFVYSYYMQQEVGQSIVTGYVSYGTFLEIVFEVYLLMYSIGWSRNPLSTSFFL